MPLLLALDTSTETCSVALLWDERVLAARAVTRASGFGGHSEHVLQLVAAVLADTGHTLSQCDAIAFGAGPGAFTGLRVACAVAQGLALGMGCLLLAVDCLSAIGLAAARAEQRASAQVLVLQDARMAELYAELVSIEGESIEVLAGPMLVTPDFEFGALGRVDLVCGNAIALYPDMAGLASLDASVKATMNSTINFPEAESIARIGALMLHQGRAVDAAAAAPIYVRDQVALTIAQRAAGQRMPA